MVSRPLWPIKAHHPPDSAGALLCVLLSRFEWVWQWQPVHHKLSIDVALRKFCCQALCFSVSVNSYCVVIYVPIFGLCQCCKYAFFVCQSCMYQCFWVIIKYMCAASVERKKNVAPILITQQKKTVTCHVSQTKQLKQSWTLHCRHIFVDSCTVLHEWAFNIPLICF